MAMMDKSFISVFHKIPVVLLGIAVILSGILFSTQAFSQTTIHGVILAQKSQKLDNVINVRLNGATEYELVEVFGRVLNNVQGVLEAKRHGSRIVPDNPHACFAVWQVRIQDSDPARVQANIIKMIQEIRNAGGKDVMNRYSGTEVDLLKAIRPGPMTAGEIQFMVF
jgi:hypothetical protein